MQRGDLIEHLKIEGVLRSPQLEAAFRDIDRKDFVEEGYKPEAYEDYPLPIGYGATLSQPTTVAFMLEQLDVREGHKVLDIGSGSGWTTALLAHLVGPKGKVIGLEIVPELVAFGQSNLRRNAGWASSRRQMCEDAHQAEIRLAVHEVIGLSQEAPFDRILVSAAPREIPKKLIEQLNPDGVMVIPVGSEGEVQKIVRVHKETDGKLETEEYPGFAFVPLR